MEKEIVIVSAVRTAVGSFNGALAGFSAVDLGVIAAREAILRAGIQPADVDETIIGNILSAGLGQNVARQISVKSGVPITSPAMSINILCGSGLRAVSLAAQMIMVGNSEIVLRRYRKHDQRSIPASASTERLPHGRWKTRGQHD